MHNCVKRTRFLFSPDNEHNILWMIPIGGVILLIIIILWLGPSTGYFFSSPNATNIRERECATHYSYGNCVGVGALCILGIVCAVALIIISIWGCYLMVTQCFPFLKRRIEQSIKPIDVIQQLTIDDEEQALFQKQVKCPRWEMMKFMVDERNPDHLFHIRVVYIFSIVFLSGGAIAGLLIGISAPVCTLFTRTLGGSVGFFHVPACNGTRVIYNDSSIGNGLIYLLLIAGVVVIGLLLPITFCQCFCKSIKEGLREPHDIDAIKAMKKVGYTDL